MKNIINRIRKNKKGIIACILVTIIAIVLCIIFFRKNTVNKIQLTKQAESESNLVDLKVEVKDQAEDEYKCLLTFTSNDTDNKIIAIEYPDGEEKIEVADAKGKEKVAIDYVVDKSDIEKKFKIITANRDIYEEQIYYTIKYNSNGGIGEFEQVSQLKSLKESITNLSPEKSGKTFIGWSRDSSATEADYFEDGNYTEDQDITLYAVYTEVKSGYTEEISNDSLIGEVSKINTSGVQNITINEETYSANIIVQNGDLVLDGQTEVAGATLTDKVYEFGDAIQDCGNATDYAQNTVILKVNGNLTINNNVTLTACKNANGYGGPKGLFIYCTGIFSNNGTVDMTARGAYAKGQKVYLWKNADATYEFIPAVGAAGGKGTAGVNGTARKTRRSEDLDLQGLEKECRKEIMEKDQQALHIREVLGSGGAGIGKTGQDASSNGGKGGNGVSDKNSNPSGGGAGNPGGKGANSKAKKGSNRNRRFTNYIWRTNN